MIAKTGETTQTSPWFCVRKSDLYIVGFLTALPGRDNPDKVYFLTNDQRDYDNSVCCLSVNNLMSSFEAIRDIMSLDRSSSESEILKNCKNIRITHLKSLAFWVAEAARFETVQKACVFLAANPLLNISNHYPANWHNWETIVKSYGRTLTLIPEKNLTFQLNLL